MKQHERLLAILVAVLCFLVGCTSGSESATEASPTATGAAASATAEPTVAPGPTTPPPEVSDQDLIDAAVAAFDADIEAGTPAADGIIAYDLLGSRVTTDGNVALSACAWNGDTVFDTVREVLYRTTVADDGTITTQNLTTSLAPGDCLNTTLIETALETVNAYEKYWHDVSAEPATFTTDPRTTELLTEDRQASSGTLTSGWVEDDVYVVAPAQLGPIQTTAAAEILWRRFSTDDVRILEIAYCLPMNRDYGLYRDDTLIDNFQEGTVSGPHAISSLQLFADPESSLGWRVAGAKAGNWGDCFLTGDWVDGANQWQPRQVPLTVLEP